MAFKAKAFAGSHCGCRYQQDYRPTLGRDGKKESGTLEVIKFYYDGAIRMEQHCYGEAATFVFGMWASGMDPDGTLHWNLPDRRTSYYDEDYLPQKLDRVDEAGNLYFDGSPFPWKLADDFAEDPRWGYPRWKVVLGRILSDERTGFKWKIKPPAACSRLKRSSISTMPPRLPAHPRCWLSWSRP